MYSALVESVKKQNLIEKLAKLHEAAHRAGLITFYPLHHQFQEGDFENWKHMTPMQVAAKQSKFCQAGSKGAEVHEQLRPKAGDVLVGQHWSSSSFANTDLDYHLKRHGIEYVIIVGLEALTCVVRFYSSLFYSRAELIFALAIGEHGTLGSGAGLSCHHGHGRHSRL